MISPDNLISFELRFFIYNSYLHDFMYRKNMDSDQEILETTYIAAMNGDWKGMLDFYKNNVPYLFSPVMLNNWMARSTT